LPFVLAACQTLSKEECVAADWNVIGEQDGAAGHDPQKRFGDHAKSCEKAGIVPDQTTWNQGYQRGLVRFCTPLNGLTHGEKGRVYNNVCPVNLDAGFRSGYRLGLTKNSKSNEIKSIKNRIRSKQSSITNNESLIAQGKIDQKEAERNNRQLQIDINNLNRDLGRKEAELNQIERRIEDYRFSQQTASLQ